MYIQTKGIRIMYCVYLTIYSGDKLPRRYIGSSKVIHVLNGYNGSIKSKKYKDIYENEQRYNKHLFKTRILSKHETHKEALEAEYNLHIKYNVSKSDLYMNMSSATRNGWFGNGYSLMTGKHHSEETKSLISEKLKLAYVEGRVVSPFKTFDTKGENNPFFGKRHSEESKDKMRKPKSYVPRWKCPHCDKEYDAGNLKQHMLKNGFTLEEYENAKNI